MTTPKINETVDGVCRRTDNSMVKWFDGSMESSTSEDLPWAKEYARSATVSDGTYNVTEAYITNRGMLLIFDRFKAFVFKRQKMYTFLHEALLVWAEDRTIPCCLVGRLSDNGEVTYGLDDEVQITYWVKDGDKFTRKSLTGGGTNPVLTSNPLLPLYMESSGTPPATTASQEDTPTNRKSRRA